MMINLLFRNFITLMLMESYGFDHVDGEGNTLLTLVNTGGFFSCCSVRLAHITRFLQKYKKLPDCVDSSRQYSFYKLVNRDIVYDYFMHYDAIDTVVKPELRYGTPDNSERLRYYSLWKNTQIKSEQFTPIPWINCEQWDDYSKIDYDGIKPLIKKYFTPSVKVKNIINSMEKKYDLSYENICVLFYRGNDKNRETNKPPYNEYLIQAKVILEHNPSIRFLLQTDETEFIEFMLKNLPDRSFYFNDEIRHMKKCDSTVDRKCRSNISIFSKNFLAITIIMSRCKYVICGSGNCDVWIMYYRGNVKNIIQI